MRTLGIIPARKGSKRLKGKNIKNLYGRPLIEWTMLQAYQSTLTDVVVASDSKKALSLGINYDYIPVPLPKKLTKDWSSIYDVILYVLDKFCDKYDIVALLEPTSPLRKKNDIDDAINLLVKNTNIADSVVSVGEIGLEKPHLAMEKTGKYVRFIWSSDAEKYYFPYGVAYVSKTKPLYKCKTFYQKRTLPYLIESWQNYEVNTLQDLKTVEAIMKWKNF